MEIRSKAALFLLVVLLVQSLVACSAIGDNPSGRHAIASATDETLSSPTIVTDPLATENPTSITEAVSNAFIVEFHEESELPKVCQGEIVPNLFKDFVRFYNAGDLESIMRLIQEDIPGFEYSDGWELVAYNTNGMVEFKFVSMSAGQGRELGFMARTPDELRSQLAARFAAGEQLRINEIQVATSTTLAGRNPVVERNQSHWTSERNADFGLQFERLVGGKAWLRGDAKGTVDCVTGKIVLWTSGVMGS